MKFKIFEYVVPGVNKPAFVSDDDVTITAPTIPPKSSKPIIPKKNIR